MAISVCSPTPGAHSAYFNAAQMLRLIFETALQTVYITLEHPDSYQKQLNLAEKLEKGMQIAGKPVRSFGAPIITELSRKHNWITTAEEKQLRNLWSKLSSLSHTSVKWIKKIRDLKREKKVYFFTYDREDFKAVTTLFHQVMDINLAFQAQHFPKAVHTALKDPQATKHKVIQEIIEKLKLTPTILAKQTASSQPSTAHQHTSASHNQS